MTLGARTVRDTDGWAAVDAWAVARDVDDEPPSRGIARAAYRLADWVAERIGDEPRASER